MPMLSVLNWKQLNTHPAPTDYWQIIAKELCKITCAKLIRKQLYARGREHTNPHHKNPSINNKDAEWFPGGGNRHATLAPNIAVCRGRRVGNLLDKYLALNRDVGEKISIYLKLFPFSLWPPTRFNCAPPSPLNGRARLFNKFQEHTTSSNFQPLHLNWIIRTLPELIAIALCSIETSRQMGDGAGRVEQGKAGQSRARQANIPSSPRRLQSQNRTETVR